MKKEGRKPVSKILLSAGSIIILVLAAVSFIVIPAMIPNNQAQTPEFGSYKGKKIEYVQGSYFADAVSYYEEQQKRWQPKLDDGAYFSIFSQAFSDSVMRLAFADEVRQSDYKPAKPLVERSMLPYFFNSSGVYSPKIFRDTPENRKAEIRKQTEEQLTVERYVKDVDTVKHSNAEVEFIADMNKHMRAFTAAFFSTADYPKSEAAEFGKKNAELFTKYDLSVITLENESEAKKLASRLKNNELVFSDAVSEYSTKQYSDEKGVLNEAYHYQLKKIIKSEDTFKEIAALEPGSVSDVVETTIGFSIFTSTAPAQPADFSNDATAELVYNYMTVYEAGIIEEYFINIAKDFSAEAAVHDFDNAAKKFAVQTAEIPAFPINYGNAQMLGSISFGTIPQLSEAQSNEKFLTTAFSLSEKEISAPIVLGKNVTVLQLKNIETNDRVSTDILQDTYTRYTAQTNMSAVQSFFMASPHLKNNVFSAFFKYFMGN